MKLIKQVFFVIFLFNLITNPIIAVEKPIGYWTSLLPYNTALGVATDGNSLYTICNQAFFIYYTGTQNNHMETFSKVEGMSDIGMKCIAYDIGTSTTVLVYANGNIDLYKDNTFYNIPDFKLKSITGIKQVNQVFIDNGIAYISTSIGILVVDLNAHLITETYQFSANNQIEPVSGFSMAGNYFYTITSNGLFKADKSSTQLQNFQIWQNLDTSGFYNSILSYNSTIYVSDIHNVYKLINDTLYNVFSTPQNIRHLDSGKSGIFISLYDTLVGDIKILNDSLRIIDSFGCQSRSNQVVQLLNGKIYVADTNFGLCEKLDKNITPYAPFGPSTASSFDLYANNKNLWIAHGGHSDGFRSNNDGSDLSNYKNDIWDNHYQLWIYPPFYDSINDIVSVLIDESDSTLYAGSFGSYGIGGVAEIKTNGTCKIYKQNTFDVSKINGGYCVAGLALDNENNLWVSLFGSTHELCIKEKSTQNWYSYSVNIPRAFPFSGGQITVDDYAQAWYIASNGGGVIGYSTNGTFSNASDDASYHLTTGVGYGNLPSNNAICITKDKSGDIWVGTDNGIGIIYGSSNCIINHCDAVIPIVQYDQFAGYLFAGENVRTIAVDGANRKWVGTDNGVWLLSSDAGKIIYRFTKDNSPLPSNHIQKITVDKITGDVYMGTESGLICYRSTATEGGVDSQNELIFPNPVPVGYTGTIAIKGLVANADVRITDINGQLVYKTIALGGQAVWNGTDYKGHRPQSGVYLVFTASIDGQKTYIGKIVFVQ